MRDTGKKVFILTNSDYPYTKDIMTHLMDTPSANGKQDGLLESDHAGLYTVEYAS